MVVDSLETTALEFFSNVGVVEDSGYRTVEVLLDDPVQEFFEGHDHLVLTFSSEVARENPAAQLLSFGSPLLQSMTDASLALGEAAHLYLSGLSLSTGRTLEKVQQHARIPGRVLSVGQEEPYLYHHGLFRFKVSLAAESQEEAFYDLAVDLHSGWTSTKLDEATLRLHASNEPEVFPETRVALELQDAYTRGLGEVEKAIVDWVNNREFSLGNLARTEKAQVAQHYDAMVRRLEASKTRKSANLERIDDRVRSTLADREKRLEDVERKYRLDVEISRVQLAVVSYPKVSLPLLVQQGKEETLAVAAWDSLVHDGYCYFPKRPGSDAAGAAS